MEASENSNAMRRSAHWPMFGKLVPRGEIVFFSQMLIITIVVSVSLYNLTRDGESDRLWVALLSSCLGYILPNPTLNKKV